MNATGGGGHAQPSLMDRPLDQEVRVLADLAIGDRMTRAEFHAIYLQSPDISRRN